MPDPTPAGGETPPASTTTTADSTTSTANVPVAITTTVPAQTGDEHDPARAKALIDKLREKEKQGEKDAKALKDAQARLDAIEAEKLSEAEKVQKERDEAIAKAQAAETTLRDQSIRLAVYGQRDALGLASADLAIVALDRSKVEFDADGQPTNVTELLTALIEREPILKGTPAKPVVPSTDGGAGGGDKPPELTADEMDAAKALGQTPEKFAALKRARQSDGSIRIRDAIGAVFKQ